MGFSVSAAAAIIGVSLLMIIEIFVGNTIPLYNDIQNSYDNMKQRAINEIQTMITIQNVTTTANASNYDLNITLKNTGSTSIDTSYLTVLINGTKNSCSSSSQFIYPENSNYLTLANLPGNGEKRLKIITKNGICSYETYTV